MVVCLENEGSINIPGRVFATWEEADQSPKDLVIYNHGEDENAMREFELLDATSMVLSEETES